MNTVCRVLRAVSLVLCFVAASCRGSDPSFQSEFVSYEELREGIGSVGKAPAPTNRYSAMVARRGSSGALGFIRMPFDLWGPFDFSARFGVFRVERAAGIGNGIFGIELDARGTDPLEFYGLYAQYTQGGLNVFVSKRGHGDPAASNVGQHFFAATTRIDGSVRHDGTNLIFSARAVGNAEPPVQIASIPLAQQTPLNPGFGAFNIGDRGEVGFDRFAFGGNGAPPAPVSPAHAAVAELFMALASALQAHDALDGTFTPDAAAASAALGAALTRLDSARTSIESLPDAKKPRSPKHVALSRLAKAAAAVAKARQILDAKGAAKAAAVKSTLESSVRNETLRAIDAILPQDLRDSLPGNAPQKKSEVAAPRVRADDR